MDLQCLENLFGITRKACDCFNEKLKIGEGEEVDTTWYTKSKSDYYLDELIGIVSMWQADHSTTCDETLAEFYKKAFTIGLRDTKKDVLRAISDRFTKVDRDFSGFLGTKSFTKGLDISSTDYAGFYLRMAPIKDGVMILKEVATMFEETATFNLYIYRRYIHSNAIELVDTIEDVETIANRYKVNTLETPLELPLFSDTDGWLEYFIVYETVGLTPKNNAPLCGMCGRVEAKASYFVSKYGTRGSDLESLSTWSNNSSYAYGLSLNVDFKCAAESIICRMFEILPQWADAYAGAALFRAAIAVHNQILTSPEVTRANLLGADNAASQMAIWQMDYESSIKWLAQNVNPSVNDCYVCDNRQLKVSANLL